MVFHIWLAGLFLVCCIGVTRGNTLATGGDIRAILGSRTVHGQLRENLLEARGLRASEAGGLISSPSGSKMTLNRVPIHLDREEEWPTVMGGALYLLDDEHWQAIIDGCHDICSAASATRSNVESVLLQQELWVAFDQLYLDGIALENTRRIDRYRWHSLLFELAQTIKFVALSPEQLAAIGTDDDIHRHFFGVRELNKAAELYSLEWPTIHDRASVFRHVTRLYYADPKVDFPALSQEEIARLAASRDWETRNK